MVQRGIYLPRKRYEFLEHVSDAYVAAYGETLEEAFENAALAMFEVMTNTGKVGSSLEDSFKVEAEDEYALLYSWLEKLLLKFDVEQKLYSKFKVNMIEKTAEGLRLTAEAYGEKFDRAKHTSKIEVKAVTYHQMEIIRGRVEFTVKYILDL